MVWAFVLDFLSSFGSDVSLSHRSPYQESRVLCYKVCNPLVWFLKHVHVDTILIILLLVGIEEQIKTTFISVENIKNESIDEDVENDEIRDVT